MSVELSAVWGRLLCRIGAGWPRLPESTFDLFAGLEFYGVSEDRERQQARRNQYFSFSLRRETI